MMVADRNSKNISYPAQLGIFLGFVGAGLIIGAIISVAIWKMMTGRPIFSMADDMLKPQYYYAIMAIQAVSTFFMFFVPVYILALICYRKPTKFIGFNTNINYRQFFIVIGILILTFPLSGALAELNNILPIPKNWAIKFKAMEDARAVQEAALININSFPKYLISLLVIGLLPGLFEEVCFRAGLQNIFTRWFKGPWVAIILTSIIFSVIHISYYGFLVRFGLGIILGLVFYYSGNLWLSILFHFLYNGLQVTALYVITRSGKKTPSKDIEQNFPLWAGIIALILIIFLFIKFKEYSVLQKAKVVEDDLPDDDFHNWATAQS
ncbi:MAG TPA: type II CAAX endopeptidase family protein [Chitinophagaceae bacterium]|nr:type II CAAX endopeptidase family protein [Chitinophagaceae bacterium]